MRIVKNENLSQVATYQKKNFKMNLQKRLLKSGVIGWLLVLAIWSVVASFSNPQFFPSPEAVFYGAIELSQNGSLALYIGISFLRVITGWILGNLVAIPIGLLIGRIPFLKALFDPVINFIRFIPPLAFITLFMLWFGIGEQSKIFLIMYATVFIVIINTITGVQAVEEDKIRSARSMGASEWQIMLHVIIPASLPYMYTGAKLAMGSSFMAIVGAEMVAANEGIGYMIWNSRLYFKTDWIFVGLVILGLMGFFMDRVFQQFGNFFLKKYYVVKK
ncbi:ABC transporter permease [Bacillus cytotoxicus]|nr:MULTISPECIES: ABC transporter permease [Bacillus cereus group]QTR77759.1 ABC transporter permease [Bacillus cytotoxicus]QTR82422.1 ABC transporter permease [Bacillus cytotoxicus]QTR86160.1 ABC transporter permease [Bacillus cytotoxicus]HDR4571480.1 ABC transporter permease [Bacillus cytotoxicus]HDR4573706.1 ABC transporter permease [Bacillus cytotoxicus]